MRKDFFNDRRGIIIIVTLVMIIMLTMVALDLHETTLRTYERIRNENNSFQADSFVDSAMEHLLFEIGQHDVGYNREKTICKYSSYGVGDSSNDAEYCSEFNWLASYVENASFAVEVKGRADEAEKMKTGNKCWSSQSNFSNKCYTVPFAGTGSAGDPVRCRMYKPVFVDDPGAVLPNSQYVSESVISLKDYKLDQLNYSCNWGKLVLGHSDMDRIAVPLYYEDDTTSGTGLGEIVNPFKAALGFMSTKANNLILRVRTPCLPCVYDKKDVVLIPEKMNRFCEKGQDNTVCSDSDRYELDDGGAVTKYDLPSEGNDVVVQWRIYGEKDEESNDVCGVVAVPEQKSKMLDPKNPEEYYGSAIYEFSINYQKIKDYYLLDITEELGHDICSDPKLDDAEKRKDIDEYLRSLEKPILTLSVIASLWTEEGYPIPYLEYQVLTDYPITNPVMKIDARASVDGMGGMNTRYKDVPVSVMDFAVQN